MANFLLSFALVFYRASKCLYFSYNKMSRHRLKTVRQSSEESVKVFGRKELQSIKINAMSKEVKETQKEKKPEVKEEAVPQEEKTGKEKESTEEQQTESGKKDKGLQTEELERKLAELNDKYLRLSAEFDNYRKRTLKERIELTRTAGEQILEKILPVMDNFERALQSMEQATDIPALRKGVELIYGNFKDFLSHNGVKEMECIHSEFNPDEQEAVTKIPAPSEALKGKVIDCIQKGYTLNDKIIRFPKVVVGE